MRIRIAHSRDLTSLKDLLFYRHLDRVPKDEEIIVAEESGKILGAVTIGYKKFHFIPGTSKTRFWTMKKAETNAWVFRLFVRDDQRSKSIGKQLVKRVVSHLKNKGIKTLYAGIAPGPFDKISRRVFLSSGFSDVGSCVCLRRFCVGTLMKLQL